MKAALVQCRDALEGMMRAQRSQDDWDAANAAITAVNAALALPAPDAHPVARESLMALVDEYTDAFHTAMRPDGGLGFADGLVAKAKKEALRDALDAALAHPQQRIAEPAPPLKARPDFIAGYDAGLADGKRCAERDRAEPAAPGGSLENVVAELRVKDFWAALQAAPGDEREAFEDLLNLYWQLAFAEGAEGRNHDTDDGSAGNTRHALIASWQARAAAPATEKKS